jgi:MFS family permease
VQIADQQETSATHRFGGLLWQRNFRLLWFGETISGVGTAMAAIEIPLLAVSVLHASTFAVSALTAAAYLPWLLIGLPAGAWVDRLPVRPLMIICDVVAALLYASLPVAAWLGVLAVWQLLTVALLAGAASVFFGVAYQVYLPALVGAADLMEGNAKLQGSASVAMISGRGAAGAAAEVVGNATALLFNAGSFLVSAACLLAIRAPEPPRTRAERRTTIREEVSEGARYILRDRLLRILGLYPALANLSFIGSTSLYVLFLVRVVGVSSTGVGLLMTAGGLGGIVGAVFARRVASRLGTARTLALAALGSGAAGLLVPLTGTGAAVVYYALGTGLISGGLAAGNIIVTSFRQAYCPPAMLGRVVASQRFLAWGTIPVGALLAGVLGTALGIRPALWIMLCLYLLSGTLMLAPVVQRDRDLPAQSAGSAAATS